MQAYLQYGKELFASWSYHTPLTGLQGPNPFPMGYSRLAGTWSYPFQAANFLEFEH